MRDGIWDSNETLSRTSRNDKDLPFIDLENEDELLQWLNNDLNDKFDARKERLEYISRLEKMYEGEVYDVGPRFSGISDIDESASRRPSSIFNYMSEMTETKMSQRARVKAGIQVIPAKVGIEYENGAEAMKSLLTAKAQELDVDTRVIEGDKSNFITGCSYTFIPWNKNIGPVNPTYKQAVDLGLEIPPSVSMHMGDIDVQIYGPDRAFHQLCKKRWADVDDITLVDFINIDELKYDYPESADEIEPSSGDYIAERIYPEMHRSDKMALVGCYYRRPTKYMPNGAYIKFTRSTILEKNIIKYPYNDNQLPIVYDTDIDLRDSVNGKPFLSNIDKLQRLHDMTSASMARGIAIANSPKWFYQKGSVDPQKLGNNYSSVEVRGPIEPKLVSFNGMPVGGFEMMAKTESGIQRGSNISSMLLGEPPKNARSGLMFQSLIEQDETRESLGMAKRKKRTLAIYKMIMSRAQQFYRPEDGRIFRYLGEDNSYLIYSLEKMNLEGDYDIRFENDSALPLSGSNRIQAIIELNQATAQAGDPMFDKETIAQLLDLGNDRRFRSQATASLKAAQFKLQQILDGTGYTEPAAWDDFIVEYPIFVQALRQREYKGTNDSVKIGLHNYIKSMEFLMWEKSKMNPAFAQRSLAFKEYPIFFKVPMMNPNQIDPNKTTQEIIVNDKSKESNKEDGING